MVWKGILALLIIGASIVFPVYIRALVRVEDWRREYHYEYTDYVPEDCVLGPLTKADILATLAVFLWIPGLLVLFSRILDTILSGFEESRIENISYFILAPLLYLSARKVFQVVWEILDT